MTLHRQVDIMEVAMEILIMEDMATMGDTAEDIMEIIMEDMATEDMEEAIMVTMVDMDIEDIMEEEEEDTTKRATSLDEAESYTLFNNFHIMITSLVRRLRNIRKSYLLLCCNWFVHWFRYFHIFSTFV